MLGSCGSHREPARLLCLTRGWPKPTRPLVAHHGWAHGAAPGAPGVSPSGDRAPSWAAWGGQGFTPAPEGQAGPLASRGRAWNQQRAEKPPTPGMICHRVLCVTAGLAPRRGWRRGRREGKKHVVFIKPSKTLSFLTCFPSSRAAAGAPPVRGRQGQAGTTIFLLIFAVAYF